MTVAKVGDTVLICSNPEKSMSKYGVRPAKRRMAGTRQEVLVSTPARIRVKENKIGAYQSFVHDEYRIITNDKVKKKTIKPITFNPEHLAI